MKRDFEKHKFKEFYLFNGLCVCFSNDYDDCWVLTHTILTSHPVTYPNPNLIKPHAGTYLGPKPNPFSLSLQLL